MVDPMYYDVTQTACSPESYSILYGYRSSVDGHLLISVWLSSNISKLLLEPKVVVLQPTLGKNNIEETLMTVVSACGGQPTNRHPEAELVSQESGTTGA